MFGLRVAPRSTDPRRRLARWWPRAQEVPPETTRRPARIPVGGPLAATVGERAAAGLARRPPKLERWQLRVLAAVRQRAPGERHSWSQQRAGKLLQGSKLEWQRARARRQALRR